MRQGYKKSCTKFGPFSLGDPLTDKKINLRSIDPSTDDGRKKLIKLFHGYFIHEIKDDELMELKRIGVAAEYNDERFFGYDSFDFAGLMDWKAIIHTHRNKIYKIGLLNDQAFAAENGHDLYSNILSSSFKIMLEYYKLRLGRPRKKLLSDSYSWQTPFSTVKLVLVKPSGSKPGQIVVGARAK